MALAVRSWFLLGLCGLSLSASSNSKEESYRIYNADCPLSKSIVDSASPAWVSETERFLRPGDVVQGQVEPPRQEFIEFSLNGYSVERYRGSTFCLFDGRPVEAAKLRYTPHQYEMGSGLGYFTSPGSLGLIAHGTVHLGEDWSLGGKLIYIFSKKPVLTSIVSLMDVGYYFYKSFSVSWLVGLQYNQIRHKLNTGIDWYLLTGVALAYDWQLAKNHRLSPLLSYLYTTDFTRTKFKEVSAHSLFFALEHSYAF